LNKRNVIVSVIIASLTFLSIESSYALKVYPIAVKTPEAPAQIELTDRKDLSDVENCKLKNAIFDGRERLGFPLNSQQHPVAVGNRKAITLFADFSDYPSDKDHMTNMLEIQIPKAEEFYYNSSYGKYTLKFDYSKKIYHFGNHFDYVENGLMAGNRFINQVMSAADNDIDFSKYDFVNIVTPSKYIYDSGSYGMRGTYDGKSFYLALLGTAATIMDYREGLQPWLVHEVGHIIGMIHASNDWYPYIWDVSVNAVATAPDIYAWNKFLLGWMDDSQVDCIAKINKSKTVHLLSPLGVTSKQTKAIIIKLSANYALVVENRTKNKIDKNLGMFQEGILVYTVNINKTGGPKDVSIAVLDMTHTSNTGTIQVGKSLIAEGYEINVLQKQKSGYIVSVTKQ
jgi:M6 family metalloprotease-like protein